MRKLLSLLGVIIIIIGIAVLINIYSPQIKSYIPAGITSPGKVLSGKVIAKKNLGNSLLLTVNTPEGATLITYKKKIEEIDLLVSVGDTIEFSHVSYRPFLKDPEITRVRKETFEELKERFGKPDQESLKPERKDNEEEVKTEEQPMSSIEETEGKNRETAIQKKEELPQSEPPKEAPSAEQGGEKSTL